MTRVHDHVRPRSAPAGDVLFRQGDPGDALFVLLSGQVRLTRNENGNERQIALLGRRGDTIGEMSLLTGSARPVTARVEKEAEFLVLDRREFEIVLKDNPQVALPLARQLSEQLAQSSRLGRAPPPRHRLFAFFTPLPGPDRVVLAINLGMSLLEQSRQRVLVVDIADQPEDRLSPALGLGGEDDRGVHPEDFHSPESLGRLIRRHVSGLEFLILAADLLEEKLYSHLYPLVTALGQGWDHVIVVLGGKLTRVGRVFAEEADRVLVACPPPPVQSAKALCLELESFVPPAQIDRVELRAEAQVRRNRPGHFKIPWSIGFGRRCLSEGHPFLPAEEANTHRALDRMARHLASLRIGIAMGSGAALGYSIIGILRVLERNGIYPDLIAGSSMGALIGSFYAAGKDTEELERIALSITKAKLWSLIDFGLPWQGIVLGREVLKFLKSILGDATFDELRLPFACASTDINTGAERVLRHGGVAEAVRASLSLPFFFQPYLHQGRFLVDGGLVNPVPSSIARAMGADVCLAVNITTKPEVKQFPGFKGPRTALDRLKGPHIFKVMAKTLYTMQYGIARTGAQDADVVLAPDLSDFTWMEFHRAREIIRAGEENAEHMLPKIKSFLPFHADQCRVPLRPSLVVKPY